MIRTPVRVETTGPQMHSRRSSSTTQLATKTSSLTRGLTPHLTVLAKSATSKARPSKNQKKDLRQLYPSFFSRSVSPEDGRGRADGTLAECDARNVLDVEFS